MRRFLLVILLVFGLCACQQKSVTLIDSQGNKIILAHQWVIINYFAPWCAPCAAEIPELNRFYIENKSNVILVGVNFDEPELPILKKTIQEMKIQFPVLQKNPAQELQLPDVGAVPTTFILNPKGKISKVLTGPQTAEALKGAIHDH